MLPSKACDYKQVPPRLDSLHVCVVCKPSVFCLVCAMACYLFISLPQILKAENRLNPINLITQNPAMFVWLILTPPDSFPSPSCFLFCCNRCFFSFKSNCKNICLILCLSVSSAGVSVYHMQRPREDVRFPDTGPTESCEPPCGHWELNLCKNSQCT